MKKHLVFKISITLLFISLPIFGYFSWQAFGGTTQSKRLNVNPDLQRGLNGHWTFDGNDMRINVADVSGFNQPGYLTNLNATTTTKGVIGQGFNFTGREQVNVGTLSGGFMTTFSFWVKMATSTANQSIFTTDGFSVGVGTNASSVVIPTFSGTTIVIIDASTTAQTIPDTQWHHVVVMDPATTNVQALILGTRNNINLNGSLDDFRVYDRTLSKEEIQRLYDLGATTHENVTLNTNPDLRRGLVGHWTFDASDMRTNIADRSGNGNNGYATSVVATSTIPGKIGQAIVLAGGASGVQIPDNATLDFADTDDFTISGWFYRATSTGDIVIFGKRTDIRPSNAGYLLYIASSTQQLTLQVSDGTDTYTVTSATIVPTDKWSHITAVWDQDSAAESEIYINNIDTNATDSGTIGNVGSLANAIGAEAGDVDAEAAGGGGASTVYNTAGTSTHNVTAGVTSITVKAWGAGGGGGSGHSATQTGGAGGGGGYSTSVLSVTGPEALTVVIGGGGKGNTLSDSGHGGGTSATFGFGGGEAGVDNSSCTGCHWGGGGGGYSGVKRGSSFLIIAAGGGGGGGGGNESGVNGSAGGAGGGITGSPGVDNSAPGGGGGGTDTAGGALGISETTTPCPANTGVPGSAGVSEHGGKGCSVPDGDTGGAGGGGGGGLFGGGGGGAGGGTNDSGAGGGGGSAFADSTTAGSGTTPGNTGDADYDGTAGVGGAAGAAGNPAPDAGNGARGLVVITEAAAASGTNGNHYLDDLRIYNRALSSEERKRLYDLGNTTHISTSINTNPDLKRGLVGHWTFDGRDIRENLFDKSGQGNVGYIGTSSSPTTTIPGKIGQALDLDGVDDVIRLGNPSVQTSSTETISMWVYENSRAGSGACANGSHVLYSANSATIGTEFNEACSINGVLYYVATGGTWTTTGYTIPMKTWVHLVFVMSGADLTIYVNGVQTVTKTDNVYNTRILPTLVGGWSSNSSTADATTLYSPMRVDDVRIYNRTLSSEEAKRLYDLGR